MSQDKTTLQDLLQQLNGADGETIAKLLPQINAKVAALQSEVSAAAGRESDLRTQLKTAEGAIAERDNDIADLNDVISDLQAEVSSLKDAAVLKELGEDGEPAPTFTAIVDGVERRYALRLKKVVVPGHGPVSAADVCATEDLQREILALSSASALLVEITG